jgi:AraC family transcriptional regulator, glycine betaine-responsive activator
MSIFSLSDKRLNVQLLVLPECSMMSVACTLDPMRAANRIARKNIFEWQVLTLDGLPVTLTCGLPLVADMKFGEAVPGDVLIVVAGYNSEVHADKKIIARLAKIAPRYTAVGGVEAGSWVMARAGLLLHHRATTHWEDLEDFAARFPDIEVLPDRFVIDGRYFTTGGASPAFDLMLQLIRARKGAPFAMEVASVFIYDDTRRPTEAQHFVSLGRLNIASPKVSAAIRLMETQLDTPLPVVEIACAVNISVRSLETLFQSEFATSPGSFYRNLRLQMARRLLLETGLSIQEVTVRTGFSSPSAFSRAIRKHFGKAPGRLRK